MKQKCKYCGDYLVVAGAKPIYEEGRHIGDDYYCECIRGHYFEERKIFKEKLKLGGEDVSDNRKSFR